MTTQLLLSRGLTSEHKILFLFCQVSSSTAEQVSSNSAALFPEPWLIWPLCSYVFHSYVWNLLKECSCGSDRAEAPGGQVPTLLKAPCGTPHSIGNSQLPARAGGAGPKGSRVDTPVPGPSNHPQGNEVGTQCRLGNILKASAAQ